MISGDVVAKLLSLVVRDSIAEITSDDNGVTLAIASQSSQKWQILWVERLCYAIYRGFWEILAR
jgi:hypothetical protein